MSIQAMKRALEALEGLRDLFYQDTIEALRAAITEAERQEPFGYWSRVVWGQHDNWSFMKQSPEAFNSRTGVVGAKVVESISLYTTPQPAIPDGWLRAVDEALVGAYIGIADAADSYEVAKKKLNDLICWNVQVAIDPAVNGGRMLMPAEPTNSMEFAADTRATELRDSPKGFWYWGAIYKAMLAAAPKPENSHE